jgi:DNA-binding beta-propeller fold protein YncE
LAGSPPYSDGLGSNAKFRNPYGACVSPDGVYEIIADTSNQIIRKIVISTTSVTTLAGLAGTAGSTNGIGTNANFNGPFGVSVSPNGAFVLITEIFNHLIRQIVLSTSAVTTLAGVLGSGSTNGVGTNAYFHSPTGVSISPNGLFALVADTVNHLIRHIILSTASVTTLAGLAPSGSTNGIGTNAKFNAPDGVSVSPDSAVAVIADSQNHQLRLIVISTASVSPLAGLTGTSGSTNGVGSNGKFCNPYGVSFSPDASFVLVADSSNHLLRQVIIAVHSRGCGLILRLHRWNWNQCSTLQSVCC